MRFFFLIFALIMLLGQVYISWHMWRLLPLAGACKTVIVALMAVPWLCMLTMFLLPLDRLPFALATTLELIATAWLIIMLYAVLVFLVLDVGRLVHLVPRNWLMANVWTSVAVIGGLAAVFAYGYVHYQHKTRVSLRVTTHKPLERRLKIVMMTDLHLGYTIRNAEFSRWIDLVNAEQPDLILIGGDITDSSIPALQKQGTAQLFHRFTAPVYAALGNHEYFAGDSAAARFYSDAGIHLLRDEQAVVHGVRIIGRDDRSNPRRLSVNQLTGGDTTRFTILIDHQPFHLEDAEQAGVDFQLSGHTHHGQVWPLSWVTEAMYECAFGSHRRGATQYYVSSGIGIWGGKFRIGTRSEYAVLTLEN